jgi:hypothetical protein
MRDKAMRLLLSLAVTLALGFGARQAFATAAPLPGSGVSCSTCDYWCVTQMGANYGFCLNGRCVCRSGP